MCPRGTIFNQKHRVCDWWYNVKCEDSTEFYDLNLDLLLLEKGVGTAVTSLDVPPPIDPLVEDFGTLFPTESNDLDELLEEFGLTNLLTEDNSRSDDDNHDIVELEHLTSHLNDLMVATSNLKPETTTVPGEKDEGLTRREKLRRRLRKKLLRRKRLKAMKQENVDEKGHSPSPSGGSGMSLCSIMGICDQLPSPPEDTNLLPYGDIRSSASEENPTIVSPPKGFVKNLRTEEKSASEIRNLFRNSSPPEDDWVPKVNPHRRPKSLDESSRTARSPKMIPDATSEEEKSITATTEGITAAFLSLKDNFEVKDCNKDDNNDTWRPMELDEASGVIRPLISELINPVNSTWEKDDWVPGAGPTKVRD